MKRWLLILGRLIIAGIFLYAGYEKAREPWIKFAVSVDEFKAVPDSWVQPIARILPWGEIALAIALITPILTRWFALIATLLLTLFLGVGIRAYALGADRRLRVLWRGAQRRHRCGVVCGTCGDAGTGAGGHDRRVPDGPHADAWSGWYEI